MYGAITKSPTSIVWLVVSSSTWSQCGLPHHRVTLLVAPYHACGPEMVGARCRAVGIGGIACSLPARECGAFMADVQAGLKAKLRRWIPAMQMCETIHSGGLIGSTIFPMPVVMGELNAQRSKLKAGRGPWGMWGCGGGCGAVGFVGACSLVTLAPRTFELLEHAHTHARTRAHTHTHTACPRVPPERKGRIPPLTPMPTARHGAARPRNATHPNPNPNPNTTQHNPNPNPNTMQCNALPQATAGTSA